MPPRPLTLHPSALSSEEYDLFTTSFLELALLSQQQQLRKDYGALCTQYEQTPITVQALRGWLREKYPDLRRDTIDRILKLFSPQLSQGDAVSGSQFFAALRLVIHAQNGNGDDIEKGLVFVPAQLSGQVSQPLPYAGGSFYSPDDAPGCGCSIRFWFALCFWIAVFRLVFYGDP